MRKEINITVSGPQGSGKTTIADLITHLLTIEGFLVEHIPMEELTPSFYRAGAVGQRQFAIRNSTVIKVGEKSTPLPSNK